MKKLFFLFLMSMSVIAATIEITSFRKLDPEEWRDNGAEVCGKVTGLEGDTALVQVTSDPKKNPGIYWTLAAGSNVKPFCHIIATYTGTVSVSVGNVVAKRSL